MVSASPARGLGSLLRARAALCALGLLARLAHGSFRFRGVRLRVARGCFAPAFVSTGLLYDVASRALGGRRLGCDVGTGPGSLALALARELGAEVVGTDVDVRCLRCAWENAVANGLDHLFHPVACREAQALRSGAFEFAVANPPYLPLDPAGPAGVAACGGRRLEVLNAVLRDSVRVLREGGVLLFTASSLASVSGARLVGERWALFDSVRAYLYVKPPARVAPP